MGLVEAGGGGRRGQRGTSWHSELLTAANEASRRRAAKRTPAEGSAAQEQRQRQCRHRKVQKAQRWWWTGSPTVAASCHVPFTSLFQLAEHDSSGQALVRAPVVLSSVSHELQNLLVLNSSCT